MADKVSNAKTSLSCEDVIVRAVQFFSTERLRATSQTGRAATFQGRPPIPCGLILLTVIAYFAFILPGVILHLLVIRRLFRFQNLVVTTSVIQPGVTDVTVMYPPWAGKTVSKFLSALPSVESV